MTDGCITITTLTRSLKNNDLVDKKSDFGHFCVELIIFGDGQGFWITGTLIFVMNQIKAS